MEIEKPTLPKLNKPNTTDVVLNKFETLICSTENADPSPNFIWILTNSTDLLENSSVIYQQTKSANFIKLLNNTGKQLSNLHVSTLELYGSFDLLAKHIVCMIEHPLLSKPFFKTTKINLLCNIISLLKQPKMKYYPNCKKSSI
jgi:hypothetical protein